MPPSEAFCLPNITSPAPNSAGVVSAQRFEGVEAALIEARDRILHALDFELAEVRLLKSRARHASSPTRLALAESWGDPVPDVLHQPPLPSNVVSVGRDVFAPKQQLPSEAALDPELERATIVELNAALAAAFSQMTAQ